MASNQTTQPVTFTVYYDGKCPLCRREIGLYKKSKGANTVIWSDVSSPDSSLPPGVVRDDALQRFHIKDAKGSIHSGAAAFIELWHHLPGYRALGRACNNQPIRKILEFFYIKFLEVRPLIKTLITD
jgi:predicted DCC family thiol-disulfide oxidoreductase YuxK